MKANKKNWLCLHFKCIKIMNKFNFVNFLKVLFILIFLNSCGHKNNTESIFDELDKKGIKTIADLDNYLFNNSKENKKLDSIKIDSNYRSRVLNILLNDTSYRSKGDSLIVGYFGKITLSNGINIGNSVRDMLGSDFSDPELKNASTEMVRNLSSVYGKENFAIKYLEKRIEELSKKK